MRVTLCHGFGSPRLQATAECKADCVVLAFDSLPTPEHRLLSTPQS